MSFISVSPYQVIIPGGHPPPAIPNQLTSISQTGTSIAGGIDVTTVEPAVEPTVEPAVEPKYGFAIVPLNDKLKMSYWRYVIYPVQYLLLVVLMSHQSSLHKGLVVVDIRIQRSDPRFIRVR